MVVSHISMYANSAHSRRNQFRRSLTLVDYISEEDNENESEYNEESKLIYKTDSPLLPRDNNMISQSSTHGESSLKTSPSDENNAKCAKRRSSFQNRKSCSRSISWDVGTTVHNLTCAESKDSQRPGISTSQILTKMKDRIRQKVFNSSEWPDAAALVQEKYRQRAIDAIESLNNRIESSNSECIPMQDLGFRDRTLPRPDRGRYSLPNSSTRFLEAHSQANIKYLKRRSASEGQVERNLRMGRGIVCSNEDLRSIMWDYKKRRSVHFRSHSIDYANLQKEKLQNQSSSNSLSREQSSYMGAFNVELDGNDSDGRSGSTHNLYPDVLVKSAENSPVSQNSTNIDADPNGNILPRKDANSGLDIVFEEPGTSCEDNNAEFDPEILGSAIEDYLDSMIQNKSISDCDSEAEGKTISDGYSDKVSINDIEREEARESAGFWTRLLCIFRGQDVTN